MNKKMQLVLDIMQLGVEISKSAETDVFVEYAGHVDCLYVRIYESGWENRYATDRYNTKKNGRKTEEYYDRYVYLDIKLGRSEKDIIEILEEIYAELSKYKEELK